MVKYISIQEIFAKIARDYGVNNIDKFDMIEWAAEALSFIGTRSVEETAVAFLKVKDYHCELPSNVHLINEIRKYRHESVEDFDSLCPGDLSKKLEEPTQPESVNLQVSCGCNPISDLPNNDPRNLSVGLEGVILTEDGMALTNDFSFRHVPFFHFTFGLESWNINPYLCREFSHVRQTLNEYFMSPESKRRHLYEYCGHEYKVLTNGHLRFNFESGVIAMSYRRTPVDPITGYPLVPDQVRHKTAITKYIAMKIAEREFFNNVEGSTSKLQKFESDWHWYCNSAGNFDLMPKTDDEYQAIKQVWNNLIPNEASYNNYFGYINRG